MNRFIEAIVDHPIRSALAAGTAPVVAFTINCGGGDNSKPTPDDLKSPTANVLVTESPMPSATAMATQVTESPTSIPTPEPTKVIKKILGNEVIPTTAETIINLTETAYQNNPSSSFPLDWAQRNIENCQLGDPQARDGSPKHIAQARAGSCSNLIEQYYQVYKYSGDENFYNAALAVYNYAITELPDQRDYIDSYMKLRKIE